MAKQIKFALEMNGVKIRSIEDLRENFDLETAVKYYLDGKLATWLEQRLYEEEEENVRAIDRNSPNLKEELCKALGVQCNERSSLDVEQLKRLNEKSRLLKEKTDDKDIIAHANITAFNQEDLKEILDADETTIYLCGDNFSIPMRYTNRKYIGILGMPYIKINAKQQNELDNIGIEFENVILPWTSCIADTPKIISGEAWYVKEATNKSPSECATPFVDIPVWMRKKTQSVVYDHSNPTPIKDNEPFIDIPIWMRKK